MQKVVRERAYDQDGLATETTEVTRTDASRTVDPSSVVAARVVWFIGGVIMALLALRFVLVLLGASTASSFVNFIYGLSYPFAVPFFGIFGYTIQYGVARVELSTIVAIVIYGLVAYGIARLLTIRRPEATL